MLASVLLSPVAIQASIEILRAYVRLRESLGGQADLSRRLDDLETRDDGHFKLVFNAIPGLMEAPAVSPDDVPIGGLIMPGLYPVPFGGVRRVSS